MLGNQNCICQPKNEPEPVFVGRQSLAALTQTKYGFQIICFTFMNVTAFQDDKVNKMLN